ncbi:hypothetical protein GXW74_22660 [Roseomonas eburnea]|uniref:DUF4439 domain-containing protein n=1 Tax=Neoroseomonas eburnea TaxID=1346889 RepID=A0A9X9XHW9_9PROT|nr:hypothetical protein [Neoroseomonas eburnea]MBR0683305.1 hypothetical protein [Neoroseomonas eburnea]
MTGGGAPLPRNCLALFALVLVAGCSLPPNTALRDWARTASILADHPAAVAPEPGAAPPRAAPAPDPGDEAARARRDGLVAQQQALAVYLYALGVLAEEEQPLTFREEPYAALAPRAAAADPAAARAVAEIGAILRAAREANLPPGARANSAGQATVVEDHRLRSVIRAADTPVQALVAALAAGIAAAPPAGAERRPGADREAYLRVLAAIGEGHAMLKARARHITQEDLARELRAEEDRLIRAAYRLPADPAIGARRPLGGVVAEVVQP